jgi:hypothetical protein
MCESFGTNQNLKMKNDAISFLPHKDDGNNDDDNINSIKSDQDYDKDNDDDDDGTDKSDHNILKRRIHMDQASNSRIQPFKSSSSSSSSSRHGARNQNRSRHLCQWILSTWSNKLQKDDLILDIAGGNGELAARLLFCHHFRVVLVDPRPTNIVSTFQTHVLPRLPKRHQERFRHRWETNPQSIHDLVKERFQSLQIMFEEQAVGPHHPILYHAVRTCQLMVGLHADGATESIVNVATLYSKPFVVIPCCVFPNFNPHRVLIDSRQGHGIIPVRTHAQFCEYLVAKDTRFRREVLPFEGRNVAIVWDGPSQHPHQEQQEQGQP